MNISPKVRRSEGLTFAAELPWSQLGHWAGLICWRYGVEILRGVIVPSGKNRGSTLRLIRCCQFVLTLSFASVGSVSL
jgi:hypothetical protein